MAGLTGMGSVKGGELEGGRGVVCGSGIGAFIAMQTAMGFDFNEGGCERGVWTGCLSFSGLPGSKAAAAPLSPVFCPPQEANAMPAAVSSFALEGE